MKGYFPFCRTGGEIRSHVDVKVFRVLATELGSMKKQLGFGAKIIGACCGHRGSDGSAWH